MVKILFVCHGNICRSPMAHFYFAQLVREKGREAEVYIDSAATSTEELGNPIYPPAAAKLREKGVALLPHRSVQLERADYDRYDRIIVMDSANVRNTLRICGGDPEGKICRLMALVGQERDVADPWYTGDFEATWRDVQAGCNALFAQLTEK